MSILYTYRRQGIFIKTTMGRINFNQIDRIEQQGSVERMRKRSKSNKIKNEKRGDKPKKSADKRMCFAF